jgi:hypothetical protein
VKAQIALLLAPPMAQSLGLRELEVVLPFDKREKLLDRKRA